MSQRTRARITSRSRSSLQRAGTGTGNALFSRYPAIRPERGAAQTARIHFPSRRLSPWNSSGQPAGVIVDRNTVRSSVFRPQGNSRLSIFRAARSSRSSANSDVFPNGLLSAGSPYHVNSPQFWPNGIDRCKFEVYHIAVNWGDGERPMVWDRIIEFYDRIFRQDIKFTKTI